MATAFDEPRDLGVEGELATLDQLGRRGGHEEVANVGSAAWVKAEFGRELPEIPQIQAREGGVRSWDALGARLRRSSSPKCRSSIEIAARSTLGTGIDVEGASPSHLPRPFSRNEVQP